MATDSVSISDESFEPESPAFYEVRIERASTVTECSPMSAHFSRYSRTNSEASVFSDPMYESSVADSRFSVDSPIARSITRSKAVLARLVMKQHGHDADDRWKDQEEIDLELEMMKEKFSKLLLGEDMSGGGKGVCSAVALSNAITNLYATVFSQCYKLEPLSPEKKTMWKSEMKCLLSVCDYIVEFVPLQQDFEDGTHVEVMTSRPRADIYINLPALQKLDTMLLEILESFREAEFHYADERALTVRSKNSPSISLRRVVQRMEEKWWLPVPCIPPGGLSEKSKKHLQHKRECANQILKAAMAINSNVLSEMGIPDSYLSNLPKSGKASVGDSIYRYMSSNENFSPGHLLSCINLASEHEALELADQVEAAMYVWQRKACATYSKPTWEMVKEFTTDGDKNVTLATRAESLLLCLKHMYPGLSQTSLDTCKIQYNKDIGQAILESYSRVLESLAFNIVAWIDDVLQVDGLQNDGSHNHSSQ